MKNLITSIVLLISISSYQKTQAQGSQNVYRPKMDAQVTHNLELMIKGDGAFDRRDHKYFLIAHSPDIVAHIMGSTEPIRGRDALGAAIAGMLKMFPDIHVYNDYPIQFGDGSWTTVIGRVTGTFSGELVLPNGKVVSGTGKSFDLTLTTSARWEGDLMVEEWVFWDSALMNQQIGLQ